MSELTQCPECHGHLKDSTKCRCGWTAPQVAQAQANPGHIPCADDPLCRFPGRLWFSGMDRKARVCVDHACTRYAKGERNEEAA